MLLFLPLLLPGALPLPLLIVFPASVPFWCFLFSLFCSLVPPPPSSYCLPSTSSALVLFLFYLLFLSLSLYLSPSSSPPSFTHVLHLLPSHPPSSSLISSLLFLFFFILFLFDVSFFLSTSSDEAEIGETFGDGFKRFLTVYLSVLRL